MNALEWCNLPTSVWMYGCDESPRLKTGKEFKKHIEFLIEQGAVSVEIEVGDSDYATGWDLNDLYDVEQGDITKKNVRFASATIIELPQDLTKALDIVMNLVQEFSGPSSVEWYDKTTNKIIVEYMIST